MTAPATNPATAEPSGASSAFTADDARVLSARRLVDEGKFKEAEEFLKMPDRAANGECAELREIIQRIRMAYALDADQLLARLRDAIPDVTSQDLERWRRAGQVQFRMIDGRVAYFGREPANVFRFCPEAIRRRRPGQLPAGGSQLPAATEPASKAWKLEDHLARIIEASEREHRADVLAVKHRVRYTLTIKPDAPGAKPGATIKVWLPFPQEHARQRKVRLLGTSPAHQVLAASGSCPQRTIYFEKRIEPPKARTETRAGSLDFTAEYEFTSAGYYPMLDPARAQRLPSDWGDRDLRQRPPHVQFTPALRQTVAHVVGDEANPLLKARRIFEFIARNMAYCAEEEYSTIPSLSGKALASRRGDCGVQSMLFITMCRCAGVPARWQSGWQTRPDGCDMHDWAEFYVVPFGWLPADPSYGLRDSPDPRIREFYFGHQDAYRMIVNLDYGSALSPPKSSFRSEPLDFQRGEVEIDGHNLYFPWWDYDIDVEYGPADGN